MKPLLRRSLIALGTLALALLAADWVVGRWFPMPASMFQLDPVLLYVTKPGARSTKRVPVGDTRRWVTTELNSHGQRGPELAVPKHAPRIAVYGDSFVLAEDVDLEDTFVERLGAELAANGPAEMVNCGVTGYGPDQACLRFEREAEELAPDLAVFLLYSSNDFGDLVRNKIFRVGDDGRAALNAYTLAPALVADFERRSAAARGPAILRAVESWLDARRHREELRTRAAPPPYIEWYLRAGPDEYAEYVREGDLAVRQVWEDYYDADLALFPEWPSSVFKVKLMRAVVQRIRDECARRKVPLFALVVPSAVDLCPTGEIHVDPARYPTWRPARLTGILEQITTELGIPHANLYEPFRAAGPDGLYFGGDNLHWNAAGQALAARVVAEALRAQALWPPRPR